MLKKITFGLISALFLIGGTACQKENVSKENISQVCFKDHCFQVEIAKTKAEKERGLMNRDFLDSDKGMLFIFEDEAEKSFWMKNTKIPLDMIFLNKDKEVISIVKNAQPCMEEPCQIYSSEGKAMYGLEVNGGVVDEIGLEKGNSIDF